MTASAGATGTTCRGTPWCRAKDLAILGLPNSRVGPSPEPQAFAWAGGVRGAPCSGGRGGGGPRARVGPRCPGSVGSGSFPTLLRVGCRETFLEAQVSGPLALALTKSPDKGLATCRETFWQPAD